MLVCSGQSWEFKVCASLIGKLLHKQKFFSWMNELCSLSLNFAETAAQTNISLWIAGPCSERRLLLVPLTGLLHSTFSLNEIRLDFGCGGGGQSLDGGHRPIGCWAHAEGGIRPQLGSYWMVSRADAFPSAILHLKDNPLEIPPQMLTTEESAL